MITFAELTKQVHLVKDLILSDMICGTGDEAKDEEKQFSKQLSAMKSWFAKISWANKKHYILALLKDVRSAWTLSCILKSIWNCEPKDAVLSTHEYTAWSSYDRVPMDHNRTCLPVGTLSQVMTNGRFWFLSLEPQAQAIVMLELLSLSGGPIMWVVLKRSQILYEKYRIQQLHNLQDCIMLDNSSLTEPRLVEQKKHVNPAAKQESSNWTPSSRQGSAQKELAENLLHWNRTIKVMRDSLKLEELEMTFKDGTKSKIWKVNRQNPEAIETVDYIQLLPSELAKKILSYLPQYSLSEYTKVNKYWSYLIEEYLTELSTRDKLDLSLEKLQQLMLCHDTSLDYLSPMIQGLKPASAAFTSTLIPSTKIKQVQATSMKASEKSAGAYSFKHLVCDNLAKPILTKKPISNLAELSERLKLRGAADENTWNWCKNIIKNRKYQKFKRQAGGILPHDNVYFSYPLMKETLDVPLRLPLIKDPAVNDEFKPKRNVSNATLIMPKRPKYKRFNLWSKDFSSLYPIYKIPSHASPI